MLGLGSVETEATLKFIGSDIMTLQELADKINRLIEITHLQHKDPSKIEVGIYVKRIGTVGPLPTVGIQHIATGIDWDAGKCIITPIKDLREIDADELASIRKKFDEMGWAYYEATKKLKPKKT